MTGYLIEYKEKTPFPYREEQGENSIERRKALVSREILV